MPGCDSCGLCPSLAAFSLISFSTRACLNLCPRHRRQDFTFSPTEQWYLPSNAGRSVSLSRDLPTCSVRHTPPRLTANSRVFVCNCCPYITFRKKNPLLSLSVSLSPSLSLSLSIPHTHNHAIFPFFIWCPPCPGYHFPLKSLSDTEWKQQMKVLCTCNSALCQQPFTVCCH